ncbi:MAG: cobamide remodeling phosphodiesterase CbiR [Candidatus Heimdallarchaeota archaeon]
MTLLFGIRPFEFEDFLKMVVDGRLDLSQANYLDVLQTTLGNEFKHFEITADLAYVLPGLLTPDVVTGLRTYKDEHNYTCSVHLPLWSVELASPIPHIQQASIDCMIESIELTKPLNPTCWVIHATGGIVSEFTSFDLPDFAKELMNNTFADRASENLAQILEKTRIDSRKLAVENVEFPFRFMDNLIAELDLGICFDTGHLLAGFSGQWGDNGIIDFFETYKDRIAELHLHDGASSPRVDHKPLGSGDLPVRGLMTSLSDAEFTGPIVLELSTEDVTKSMDFLRKHTPDVI